MRLVIDVPELLEKKAGDRTMVRLFINRMLSSTFGDVNEVEAGEIIKKIILGSETGVTESNATTLKEIKRLAEDF